MINNQKLTIEDIEKHYYPGIWDSCDQITNLPDQKLGYYAYVLQGMLSDGTELPLEAAGGMFQCPGGYPHVLVSHPLKLITEPIEELKIYSETVKLPTGRESFTNFNLFFRLYINGGVGHPVVLRNGYLLKCLDDAGIKSFEEVEDCKAVVVYNHLPVNPEISAFVQFIK